MLYLFYRSLTAFIYERKDISPMHFTLLSSHNITLFIGYLGLVPPPTRARKLVLYNISIKPIPPCKSIIKSIIFIFIYFYCKYLFVNYILFFNIILHLLIKYFSIYYKIIFTSTESFLEGITIINCKACFSANCETALILVKRNA